MNSSNFVFENVSLFRAKDNVTDLSAAFIFLEKYSRNNLLSNTRICLHDFDDSDLHVMLIYHSIHHIVPIHRHPIKDEVLVVHSGACIYNDYGSMPLPSNNPISTTCGPGSILLISSKN